MELKYKKFLLNILEQLVSIDSSRFEDDIAQYICEILEEIGIKFDVFGEKRRKNVIGRTKNSKLLIVTHTDTVPPSKSWSFDPFKLRISKRRVYGLGVCDNKGPIASLLTALKIMKEKGKIINGFGFAFFADEERGSEKGAILALKDGKIIENYALVLDIGHNMKSISIGEKGILHLKIVSRGISAHASSPRRGINAIHNIMDFLYMIRVYDFDVKKSEIFSKPTISIGKINGGTAVNIVPDYAEAEVDLRFLPGTTHIDILRDFEKLLNMLKMRREGMDIKINVLHASEPYILNKDNLFLKSIINVYRKTFRKDPELIGLSGSTICKYLVHANIDSIGIGIGNTAHEADEYVEEKELWMLTKFLINLFSGNAQKLPL